MDDEVTPIGCHLWNNESLTREELDASLELTVEYDHDPHDIRKLLKCKTCGQLYFYESKEDSGWVPDRDSPYRQWIPVENREAADTLLDESPVSLLLLHQSIRIDFPSDADGPTAPYCFMQDIRS